jgi:hypothetical protein
LSLPSWSRTPSAFQVPSGNDRRRRANDSPASASTRSWTAIRVSSPYSAITSPMRSRVRLMAATRARMLRPLRVEVRELRITQASMSSRMRPPSTILTGGISGPSPNTSGVPTVKLPGFGPPTSTSCMASPVQHTSFSPEKIGATIRMSFMCAAPAHGSLVTKASPSAMPTLGPRRSITALTAKLRHSDSRVV